MTSRDEEPFQPLFRMCKPEDIWQISKTVGRGAFGYVHLASRVEPPHEEVAIKVIDCDVDTDNELESIRREVRILRDCNHRNVVTFYASYRSLDMSMWIVMEYCGGGSVSDLLKYKALGEDECAFVLRETLQGLHHLHEECKKHIIHRDMKSANLLLTAEGDVKVADFGVSKILDIAIADRKTSSFVGTPHWMAPEVIMGKKYDARCDIWSVGIVGIEMAEQHPPKFNVNMHGVLAAIPKLPAPRLSHSDEHSEEFCSFLSAVLTKSPQERPSALEALNHALFSGTKTSGNAGDARQVPYKTVKSTSTMVESVANTSRMARGREKLKEFISFVALEKAAGRKPPRPRRRAVRQGGFSKGGSHKISRNGSQWTRTRSRGTGVSKSSLAFASDTVTDENDAILGQWGTTVANSKSGSVVSSNSRIFRGTLESSTGFNSTLGKSRLSNSQDQRIRKGAASSQKKNCGSKLVGDEAQAYYPPLKHSLRPQDSTPIHKQASLAKVDELDGDDEENEMYDEDTGENAEEISDKSNDLNEGNSNWGSGDDGDRVHNRQDSSKLEHQIGLRTPHEMSDSDTDTESSSKDMNFDPGPLKGEPLSPTAKLESETPPPVPWGHVPSPSDLLFLDKDRRKPIEREVNKDRTILQKYSGEENCEGGNCESDGMRSSTAEIKSDFDVSEHAILPLEFSMEEDISVGSADEVMPKRLTVLSGAASPPRSPMMAREVLRKSSKFNMQEKELKTDTLINRALTRSNVNDMDRDSRCGTMNSNEDGVSHRDHSKIDYAEASDNAKFIIDFYQSCSLEKHTMGNLLKIQLWKPEEHYC